MKKIVKISLCIALLFVAPNIYCAEDIPAKTQLLRNPSMPTPTTPAEMELFRQTLVQYNQIYRLQKGLVPFTRLQERQLKQDLKKSDQEQKRKTADREIVEQASGSKKQGLDASQTDKNFSTLFSAATRNVFDTYLAALSKKSSAAPSQDKPL